MASTSQQKIQDTGISPWKVIAVGTVFFYETEIAGFHCHTIIKTIQQINSRIKEIKEDEYSNSLTKVQVCAMFRAGDIRRNILLKFIRLCMETPCFCGGSNLQVIVSPIQKVS